MGNCYCPPNKDSGAQSTTPGMVPTHVASGTVPERKKVMISARFDGGDKEEKARAIHRELKKLGVEVIMVTTKGAGDEFGSKTTLALLDAKAMVAVAFEDYGQKTKCTYCTYYEVEHCQSYGIPIMPVKLYEGAWPPAPPDFDGERLGEAQNRFVLKPTVLYVASSEPPRPFDAVAIAKELKAALDGGSALDAGSKLAEAVAEVDAEVPPSDLDKAKRVARNEGNYHILVFILRDNSDPEKQAESAEALRDLALVGKNQVEIVKAGAAEPLVALVAQGDSQGKNTAAEALANLAVNDSNKIVLARAGAIEVLVALESEGDEVGQSAATRALNSLAKNKANKKAIGKVKKEQEEGQLLSKHGPIKKEDFYDPKEDFYDPNANPKD